MEYDPTMTSYKYNSLGRDGGAPAQWHAPERADLCAGGKPPARGAGAPAPTYFLSLKAAQGSLRSCGLTRRTLS